MALPRETKAKEVPKNLFKKNIKEIENEKDERRRAKTAQIRQDYDEDSKKRFELATEARPTIQKFDKAKEVLETQLQS